MRLEAERQSSVSFFFSPYLLCLIFLLSQHSSARQFSWALQEWLRPYSALWGLVPSAPSSSSGMNHQTNWLISVGVASVPLSPASSPPKKLIKLGTLCRDPFTDGQKVVENMMLEKAKLVRLCAYWEYMSPRVHWLREGWSLKVVIQIVIKGHSVGDIASSTNLCVMG